MGWLATLLPLLAPGAWAQSPEAAPARLVPVTMFGANVLSCEVGFYAGTLPEDTRGSRRREFAALLADHGVRLLRVPGGTLANEFIWDSEAATRQVLALEPSAYLSGDPNCHMYSYFTPLDQVAGFCQATNTDLIYELNAFTYQDETGLHTLALPVPEDQFPALRHLYAPDGLASAAASVGRLVRHVREAGLPVRYWEIGNEEYGYPRLDPLRYAQIVRAYVDAVKAEDPQAAVLVTLGDNQMVQPGSDWEAWSRALLGDLRDAEYADRIGYFTLHYSWRSVCEAAVKLLDEFGFTQSRLAVTEFTCGWPEYWEATPRYRHAVLVAQFLMDLLAVPRVEIACIHDLTSQNFGVFHYNMRSFGPPDDRSYDGSLGYVPMPTATTYRLLKVLHGGRLLSAGGDLVEVSHDGAYAAVACNAGEEARTVLLRPGGYGLEVRALVGELMTGDSADATEAHVAAFAPALEGDAFRLELPPLSVAAVRATMPA